MDRLRFCLNFKFSANYQLVLQLDAAWQDQPVPMKLASFLTFLYQHENDLAEGDREFGYRLAKRLRKLSGGVQTDGITSDQDMAGFFEDVLTYDIPLFWSLRGQVVAVDVNGKLPLSIRVTDRGPRLICELGQWKRWRDDPLSWMVFGNKKPIVFCRGVLSDSVTPDLMDLMHQFTDRKNVDIPDKTRPHFVKSVVGANRQSIHWDIQVDLSAYLPQLGDPMPVLKISGDSKLVQPQLEYRYETIRIDPGEREGLLKDAKTGHLIERNKKMEAIYQEDLMALFNEFDLPFMLDNPGDIAKFMNQVVPTLKNRDWEIESTVPEIKIHADTVKLNLKIRSTDKDWFYFEPNCDVMGQKMSLQELARLMIENKGFIQTKKGYVKIDPESDTAMKVLSKFGAFRVNKTFTKSDILPLLSAGSIEGSDASSKSLIERFKGLKNGNRTPGKGFSGQLREYQQAGLTWMATLADLGLGGILADDMGLGKTVQSLAFANQYEASGPTLVIGPTNTVYNWSDEIERFLPNRKTVIYTGANRQKTRSKIGKADYVLTSFGVVKNDIEWLATQKWKAVLVDEAQHIKNPLTQISKAVKQLQGSFRLAMTGTPIENHITDLWNLFDFAVPNYLGSKRAFDATAETELDLIKTKIKPFVMRRVKQEVLSSLPDKTEVVLNCTLSEEQMKLYQTVLSAARSGVKTTTGNRQRLHILTSLLKLRQVCTYPGLLKELQLQDAPSAKLDVVKAKLTDIVDEGHKVVVFSQFTGVLDLLERWLGEQNISTERIDGSVSAKLRQERVKRFQTESDGGGVFLISLKAGGVGINLTAAEYVIHIDPWWNPAVEAQATDRVHRMGQTQKVFVYRLVTKGTIEEKITQYQAEKQQLLAQMIDQDTPNDKGLQIEELKSLLLA